jgi:hypothetical protein
MRGDPYEHPDSELWELRREQRRILRELPVTARIRVATPLELEAREGLDPGRAELILRTTAAELFHDYKTELERITEACEVRQREELRNSVRANGPGLVGSVSSRLPAEPSLDDKVLAEIADYEELWDALRMCAWADQIARDDYKAP